MGQQTLHTVTGKERNTGLEPIIVLDYQFEYSVIFLKIAIIFLNMAAFFMTIIFLKIAVVFLKNARSLFRPQIVGLRTYPYDF